jgi:hypothetical protein
MKKSNYLSAAFFLFTLMAYGQNKINYAHPIPFAPEKYVCYQTTESLKIDGLLDEAAWEAAPWTNDFRDIEGALKPKPPLKTNAKMLWDEDYFYIAAQIEEPHLWGTLTERDAIIFQDDDFEVFIDPDGDGLNYYEFEINELNTVWDLLMLRPYRDTLSGLPHYVFNWNLPDWKTAINLQGTLNDPSDVDQGWTVEMAIPWSALKELAKPDRAPKDGEYWRVNFSRVDWHMDIKEGKYVKQKDPKTGKNKAEENWVWSPQGRISMHQPETYAYVLFSEKTPGSTPVPFPVMTDEKIKWALYQLYYQQQAYFSQKRRFAADLKKLTLPTIELKDYNFKPVVFATPNTFEILAPSLQKGIYWHINESGRVWKK